MKKYIRALSIAGFDSSGGAGIQADLKTFSALNCYGMTVLTSLPIQNTTGVLKIYDLPNASIAEQISAIIEDIGVDVIKIGMLHRPEIIEIVHTKLIECSTIPIITDPVMFAKSGDLLLQEVALESLKSKILPISTIITPNIYEAQYLSGLKIISKNDMIIAAKKISIYCLGFIVIKGGHLEKEADCWDLLYDCKNQKSHWFSNKRIQTKNLHGTGCTFSAAIASYIGNKFSVYESVKNANLYINKAIVSGSKYKLGKGSGPVDHFYFMEETKCR
ncbi:bifunctional hydroxymethylpyrimidine kinase/phosphomethylpyrimidine kinase [Candidatus Bandiella numerosa]|uniref:bifunctional hydroxymethylpyrimidine kinase/phosphomethylpyrimidine kinase n=1 Tax=Candidatus Bandiella numerosa TaxID=2570586 RepID=UPI001F004C74|nr:bifunctional hydroxymethylpyrimidine kinase/phosphomethylpyrimidine kinase [Candidatus Bandiella numerosa]